VIQAARDKSKPVDLDFHVWEENWPAVSLFLGLSTQWVVQLGMAGLVYLGLNYVAVKSTVELELIPQEQWPDLFHGLRVMERAALPLLNKRD